MSEELPLRLLDKLERLEAERLAWGLVDGGFTAEELESHAVELLEEALVADNSSIPPSVSELISGLERRVLVWATPETPRRYRTRIGEAVRLLARLRQIFREGDWSVGPTLTSDFRYHIAPRRFPKRELDPHSVMESLSEAAPLSDGQQAVLRSFLGAGSTRPLMLSQFQAEAAQAVLAGLDSGQISASVIAAGTGSGKTLAFLLPTIVHLAGLSGKRSYASAIAVYPRNELLKDQIRATLERLLPLSETLSRARGRGVAIGALFGSVPWTASAVLKMREWQQVYGAGGPARACPFVRCLKCGRDMVWHESDINEDRHVLHCPARSCGASLPEGAVCLTRDKLIASPPDILFTSAEMLNRCLSHPQVSRVFGVGSHGAPALLILDEIHTYSGPHGAQVALLLRRWRKLAAARPHVIGLSATIADATRFMSELTGVFENAVRLIEPALDSMTVEGAEYSIALRGDPVSDTSLLSTTIQAAMLVRRVLDARGSGRSGGVFGSKLFVFGDNLDVINRLYDNLSDAEGYWSNGRANRRTVGSLANLRDPVIAPSHQRWVAGQSWDLCVDTGHALHSGIRVSVGRVSSQDAGVDSSTNTLVATASLEVGFDDAEVGAVLQHKAPRDPAQYVQRRGRAGRTQVMRPITLVVLSDYGRDRLAYQRYEDLFSPVVAAKYLPVENPYVLKIQAGYALFDWLSRFLPVSARTSIFDLLSGPARDSQIASVIADQLEGLLTDGDLQASFASFLEKVLEVTPRQVQDLLWTHPRSLLFEVVPTALRRLRTGWAGEPVPSRSATPLPEYLPAALFADLNLPEVMLSLPQRPSHQSRSSAPTEPKTEPMPFRQALSEFAPGRVSRRFGTSHGLLAHWIPVPIEDPDARTIDVSSFLAPGSATDLGQVAFINEGGEASIRVLRPITLELEQPPSEIEPTSNASLDWRTSFLPSEAARGISLPPTAASQHLIADVAAYLHCDGAPVEVHRFAIGTRTNTRWKHRSPGQREAYYSFSRNDEPVALGFSQTVDGIRFRLSLPPTLNSSVLASEPLQRHLRVLRFQEFVRSDAQLEGVANRFQRDWLCDAVLATLGRSALTRRVRVADLGAHEGLFSAPVLLEALSTIFDARIEDDADEPQGNRRFEDLRAILSQPSALSVLNEAARALWDPIDATWEPWLSRVAHETMGAALLSACQNLASDLSFDDLVVDVLPLRDGESGCHEIWLSEDTPGGSGIIERLAILIAEDPQRFLALVESTLQPSDSEQSRENLGKVASWLSSESSLFNESVAECAARVRGSGSHQEEVAALEQLKSALRNAGLLLTPTTLTAVNLRLLRPGSSEQTDRLYHRMASNWEESEQYLGFEVNPRVLAEIWSHDPSMDRLLTGVLSAVEGTGQSHGWRYRMLNSLLWPTAGTLRREALQYYNPYASRPSCDRLILMSLVAPSIPVVDVAQEHWLERLGEAVRGSGAADLVSSGRGLADLRQALLTLAVRPLDAGVLLVHPRVRAHTRRDGLDIVRVEVPELFGVAFDE